MLASLYIYPREDPSFHLNELLGGFGERRRIALQNLGVNHSLAFTHLSFQRNFLRLVGCREQV